MREPSLTPWVISEESGKILAAHCKCMEGLVAATLSGLILQFEFMTQKVSQRRDLLDAAIWSK